MERTERGVFINIEDSNIQVRTPYGNILKFSSEKKREVFLKKLKERFDRVKKYSKYISDLIGETVDLSRSYENEIYYKVYNEMTYK